jgi:hypothetical protein
MYIGVKQLGVSVGYVCLDQGCDIGNVWLSLEYEVNDELDHRFIGGLILTVLDSFPYEEIMAGIIDHKIASGIILTVLDGFHIGDKRWSGRVHPPYIGVESFDDFIDGVALTT